MEKGFLKPETNGDNDDARNVILGRFKPIIISKPELVVGLQVLGDQGLCALTVKFPQDKECTKSWRGRMFISKSWLN